uniref:Uncharacterized protein n=1 Tax=Globodera rostochiensis TaxID=31243 RepID=A0A914HGB8_GLORO
MTASQQTSADKWGLTEYVQQQQQRNCCHGKKKKKLRVLRVRRKKEAPFPHLLLEANQQVISLCCVLPPFFRDVPEAVRDVPEAVRDVPEAVRDVPEAVRDVPEAVRDVPEAVRDVPEAVRDVPEAVRDVPEAVRDVPEAVSEMPTLAGKCHNIHFFSILRPVLPPQGINILAWVGGGWVDVWRGWREWGQSVRNVGVVGEEKGLKMAEIREEEGPLGGWGREVHSHQQQQQQQQQQ